MYFHFWKYHANSICFSHINNLNDAYESCGDSASDYFKKSQFDRICFLLYYFFHPPSWNEEIRNDICGCVDLPYPTICGTKGLENELQGLEIAHHRCTQPGRSVQDREVLAEHKRCYKKQEKKTRLEYIGKHVAHMTLRYTICISHHTKSIKASKIYLKALHLLTWLFITWSDCLKNMSVFLMQVSHAHEDRRYLRTFLSQVFKLDSYC